MILDLAFTLNIFKNYLPSFTFFLLYFSLFFFKTKEKALKNFGGSQGSKGQGSHP